MSSLVSKVLSIISPTKPESDEYLQTKKRQKGTSQLSMDVFLNNIVPFLPLSQILEEIPLLNQTARKHVSENHETYLSTHFSPFWRAYREEKQIDASSLLRQLVGSHNKSFEFKKEHEALFEKIASDEPFLIDLVMFFEMNEPVTWLELWLNPLEEGFSAIADTFFNEDGHFGKDGQGKYHVSYSFAANSTGSAFAFWDRIEGERKHVVVLGDEGELGVVARNFDDFARMIASGVQSLGFLVAGHSADELEAPSEDDIQASLDEREEGDEEETKENLALLQRIMEKVGKPAFSVKEIHEYWVQLLDRERAHEELFALKQRD